MNKNIQGDMQIFMKVASCKVVKLYHTWRAIKMYEFKSAPFYKSLNILLTISWYNQMTLIITSRSNKRSLGAESKSRRTMLLLLLL